MSDEDFDPPPQELPDPAPEPEPAYPTLDLTELTESDREPGGGWRSLDDD